MPAHIYAGFFGGGLVYVLLMGIPYLVVEPTMRAARIGSILLGCFYGLALPLAKRAKDERIFQAFALMAGTCAFIGYMPLMNGTTEGGRLAFLSEYWLPIFLPWVIALGLYLLLRPRSPRERAFNQPNDESIADQDCFAPDEAVGYYEDGEQSSHMPRRGKTKGTTYPKKPNWTWLLLMGLGGICWGVMMLIWEADESTRLYLWGIIPVSWFCIFGGIFMVAVSASCKSSKEE